MRKNSLIACHECDLLYRVQPLPDGGTARCLRCGAALYRRKKNSLNSALSLTISGTILFALANIYPFLAFKSGGLVREITMITGVKELYAQGMEALALVALLTTIVFPFVQLAGMLYILVPLNFNRMPWKLALVFRFTRILQPWCMMEVFMLGILVSVIKLAEMASIVPGIALYSLAALILILAATAASLDPRDVWDRVGKSL